MRRRHKIPLLILLASLVITWLVAESYMLERAEARYQRQMLTLQHVFPEPSPTLTDALNTLLEPHLPALSFCLATGETSLAPATCTLDQKKAAWQVSGTLTAEQRQCLDRVVANVPWPDDLPTLSLHFVPLAAP